MLGEIKIISPIHPRTRKIIKSNNIKVDFILVDPVGYFDMIQLIKKSKLVMTDSGGLQKEAYFFKKKCITLREQTEWVELVENGFNVLVGSDKEKIIETYNSFKLVELKFDRNFYGDGNASEKIIKSLLN